VGRSGVNLSTHSYGAGAQCVADLRLPAGAPRACVVLLHGGYWRQRYGRDLMDPLAEALAGSGMASWNLEYRRVGSGGGVPQTLDDVAAAVDFVAQLLDQRGCGDVPLVLLGHSAGGHLALCAAGRHNRRGTPAAALAAVISLGGVCDLEEAARAGLSSGAAVDFVGGGPDRLPLLYAEASPPRLLPFGIPYLLVHGLADESVPWQLSAHLHERAQSAGDSGDLELLEGVGHFEPIDPSTEPGRRAQSWIEALLQRGGGCHAGPV
jgi:acetyl esterase/lipase